jgi:hypothetical protein
MRLELIPTDLWFLYGAIMEGKAKSYNRETNIVDIEGIEVFYSEAGLNSIINRVESEYSRLLQEYQQEDPTISELDPNITSILGNMVDILNIIKDRISWLP